MHRCSSCSAVLFSAETRVHDGQQFGVACCSKGRVVLKPIETVAVLDAVWRSSTPVGRALRKYARRLNNAMALASMKVAHERRASGMNLVEICPL